MRNSFDFHPVIKALRSRDSRFDPWRSITPATIKEVDGSVYPPNQPNKVWISENHSDNSRVLAWNPNGIRVPETPVLVGRSPRPPFERVVLGVDLAVAFQSPYYEQIGLLEIGPHGQNHQVPSDFNPGLDPVYVFLAAMMPLKTTVDGVSMVASVQPLVYRTGASVAYFPGQQVDLSSYTPSVGYIRHVLLYLDEEAGDIQVVEGDAVLDNGVIDVPYPDIPDTGRPSSFVPLIGGQTAIVQSSIEDARDLFPRGVIGDGLSAFPVPEDDGQVLYSEDGAWGWRTPITSDDGWLVNDDGTLLVE